MLSALDQVHEGLQVRRRPPAFQIGVAKAQIALADQAGKEVGLWMSDLGTGPGVALPSTRNRRPSGSTKSSRPSPADRPRQRPSQNSAAGRSALGRTVSHFHCRLPKGFRHCFLSSSMSRMPCSSLSCRIGRKGAARGLRQDRPWARIGARVKPPGPGHRVEKRQRLRAGVRDSSATKRLAIGPLGIELLGLTVAGLNTRK
jgi:hypothetical protein